MEAELDLLRQRVTSLETENTRLKQIIEEIANLRIENTKLKQIIKQNRTTNDPSHSSISFEVNSNNISEQIIDTSDNTPNSDVCQETKTKPKVLITSAELAQPRCTISPIRKSLEDKEVSEIRIRKIRKGLVI